jgi:anti-sigma factor RsiW
VHPFVDLSAYLDGALEREPRAAVDAHLATCDLCATRLGDLRSTARLIAALPVPVPSRSLVPRVSLPFWLAPMRTLATAASGAAMLLFVASTLVANAPIGASPGTGGAAGPPTADRNAVPAAAPAPSPRAGVTLATPTATPAPGAAFSTQSGSPTLGLDERTAKAAGATDAATAPESAGSVDPERSAYGAERRQLGPSPWAWLAVALALGGLALMLQRRLRAT